MNWIDKTGYNSSYGVMAEAFGAKCLNTASSGFLAIAAQVAGTRDAAPSGMSGLMDSLAITSELMMDLPVRWYTGQLEMDGAGASQVPSLEEMLKARYPNLIYHVFDASSSHWKTRNDYPHYLLYQEGDKAKEVLENWKPVGKNPFYGSIDGQFIAPEEIHALGNVPPGSKAVVIHPKVQERMEQDPAYAQKIYEKIDAWFAFDAVRNEAIIHGSSSDMSQAVAIGEDGNICNACASRSGGEVTFSEGGDEMVRAYYLRMEKRADFMCWLAGEQRENSIKQSIQLADADAARRRLAELKSFSRAAEALYVSKPNVNMQVSHT